MGELGIPHNHIGVTELTMKKIERRVRVKESLSPMFETSSRMRQGDARLCTIQPSLKKVTS